VRMGEPLKMTVWRVVANLLSTKYKLAKVFRIKDHTCFLCQQAQETTDHLFVQCDVVNIIWFQ